MDANYIDAKNIPLMSTEDIIEWIKWHTHRDGPPLYLPKPTPAHLLVAWDRYNHDLSIHMQMIFELQRREHPTPPTESEVSE